MYELSPKMQFDSLLFNEFSPGYPLTHGAVPGNEWIPDRD